MSKGTKVWFRWPNGQLQRVWLYDTLTSNSEILHRGVAGRRFIILKESERGKVWSPNKEYLLP